MTKIQRQKHIAQLNTILEEAGATLDRWGQYHIGNYKFDTREVNMKIYHNKIKFKSVPMTKIEILWFEKYVEQIKKKASEEQG